MGFRMMRDPVSQKEREGPLRNDAHAYHLAYTDKCARTHSQVPVSRLVGVLSFPPKRLFCPPQMRELTSRAVCQWRQKHMLLLGREALSFLDSVNIGHEFPQGKSPARAP